MLDSLYSWKHTTSSAGRFEACVLSVYTRVQFHEQLHLIQLRHLFGRDIKKAFTCVQLFISYNKLLCCRVQILTEVLPRFVIGLSALKLDKPIPSAGI